MRNYYVIVGGPNGPEVKFVTRNARRAHEIARGQVRDTKGTQVIVACGVARWQMTFKRTAS